MYQYHYGGIEIEELAIIFHALNFLVAILAIYFSFLLFKRLRNKDLTVAIFFLNEKKVAQIFLILFIGNLIFFIGNSYQIFKLHIPVIDDITALLFSIFLLYVVFALQNLLKIGEEGEIV